MGSLTGLILWDWKEGLHIVFINLGAWSHNVQTFQLNKVEQGRKHTKMYKEFKLNIVHTPGVEIIPKNKTYNESCTQYLNDYNKSGSTHHIL